MPRATTATNTRAVKAARKTKTPKPIIAETVKVNIEVVHRGPNGTPYSSWITLIPVIPIDQLKEHYTVIRHYDDRIVVYTHFVGGAMKIEVFPRREEGQMSIMIKQYKKPRPCVNGGFIRVVCTFDNSHSVNPIMTEKVWSRYCYVGENEEEAAA